MSEDAADAQSEILEMFFDEGFIPHAFVDILLSNAANKDMSQVQAVSSSLLSKLDFYTKNLTKELEMTIQKLEKLSETLPGTWTVKTDGDDNESKSVSAEGSTKLEYYLDTLGSAIRVLEVDVAKINGQLNELDNRYESSSNVVGQLKELEKIKLRLHEVLNLFVQIKSILTISSTDNFKDSASIKDEDKTPVTLEDFKGSLQALETTISQSLIDSAKRESLTEKDGNLLTRIKLFIALKPLFQGIDKFYPIYSHFVDVIRKKTNEYLSTKDIGGDLDW